MVPGDWILQVQIGVGLEHRSGERRLARLPRPGQEQRRELAGKTPQPRVEGISSMANCNLCFQSAIQGMTVSP